MHGLTPLAQGWTLRGEHLPARLMEDGAQEGFTLPGAQDLSAFAELLGMDGETPPSAPEKEAPFPLPAMLPEDMPGTAELTREIDLRLLDADDASLRFDLLIGRGEALINDMVVAGFDHGPLEIDMSLLACTADTHTITLRFDDTRPAGVCAPVLLHTCAHAGFESLRIAPEGPSSLCLRACVCAHDAGDFRLHVIPCPADGADAAANPPQAREIALSLHAGERREISLSFELPGKPFIPGRPCAAPSVKAMLWQNRRLCDCATLLCGLPGAPLPSFVPLDAQDLRLEPDALASLLLGVHALCAYADLPVSDPHARALLAAGVQLRLHDPEGSAFVSRLPCVCPQTQPISLPDRQAADFPVHSAWALGGMTGQPRHPDPDDDADELLAELAGRRIDSESEEARGVLSWLRAVRVRLNAEAARQGRFEGALCAPGELRDPDIADALRTALAPVHLSALPLYGAWWTLSRFSASLHACIDRDALPAAVRDSAEPLMAHASLETEEGDVLAAFDGPCPASGGSVGTLSAVLPEIPCALLLHTRITCGGAVVEQSTMPVYVGDRGLLEAAFA